MPQLPPLPLTAKTNNEKMLRMIQSVIKVLGNDLFICSCKSNVMEAQS